MRPGRFSYQPVSGRTFKDMDIVIQHDTTQSHKCSTIEFCLIYSKSSSLLRFIKSCKYAVLMIFNKSRDLIRIGIFAIYKHVYI